MLEKIASLERRSVQQKREINRLRVKCGESFNRDKDAAAIAQASAPEGGVPK